MTRPHEAKAKLIHFLLVEDDADHAHIIRRGLQRARIISSIDWVQDGELAISYLCKQGEMANVRTPDVILLDLKLPKVDGFEVLAFMQDHPEYKTIPVVVLSTSDHENDKRRAYEAGANSYLVKPLSAETFLQLMDDLSYYWGIWNAPPPPYKL